MCFARYLAKRRLEDSDEDSDSQFGSMCFTPPRPKGPGPDAPPTAVKNQTAVKRLPPGPLLKLGGQQLDAQKQIAKPVAQVQVPEIVAKKIAPINPEVKDRKAVAPINPHVKDRKAKTLAVRAAKPKKRISGKKSLARTSPKNTAPIKDADIQISNPCLCISKGQEYRVELCGYDENRKRVYVFGANSKTYGKKLREHAEAMKKLMQKTPGITKAMVLKFKKELQEKE